MKICVLDHSKICDNCGTCEDRCELDPTKVCDNCFRCLDAMAERPYEEIPISAVYPEKKTYVEKEEMVPVKPHYIDAQTLYGLTGKRIR